MAKKTRISKHKCFDVVAFGAHPDDVEICAGGTVKNLTLQGKNVAIVDLTKGELSSRGTVEERKKEAENAAKILGVSARYNLGLPDGDLGYKKVYEKKIVDIIRELKPTLVFIPPNIERHPDHVEAHNLIKRALFLAALPKYGATKSKLVSPHRVPYVFQYEMRYEIPFTVLVDISGSYNDKMSSIFAHKTQIYDGKSSITGEKSFLFTSGATEAISTRTLYYGAMIGVTHAEPFQYMGAIGTADIWNFCNSSMINSAANQFIFPGRS